MIGFIVNVHLIIIYNYINPQGPEIVYGLIWQSVIFSILEIDLTEVIIQSCHLR